MPDPLPSMRTADVVEVVEEELEVEVKLVNDVGRVVVVVHALQAVVVKVCGTKTLVVEVEVVQVLTLIAVAACGCKAHLCRVVSNGPRQIVILVSITSAMSENGICMSG